MACRERRLVGGPPLDIRDDQGDEHRRKSGNTAKATTPANPALY
jgi:hypothetical protein